jgi:hypothetical protein
MWYRARRTKVVGLAIVLCAAASGCATVTRGTSEDLIVKTVPEGAKVEVTLGSGGRESCAATPCTIRLPRRTQATVLIEKEGFRSVRAEVRGKLGAFVPLGVVGAAVDVASGAALRLEPNPLEVTLVPGSGTVDYVPPPAGASATSPMKSR